MDLPAEILGALRSTRPGQSPATVLRQNHAIEHATVTLINRKSPGAQVIARSDLQGFIVYGDVDTVILQSAAEEALARLQAGESSLAVHPNCGTNLVTAGVLSGLAALAAGSGRNRSLWDRIPGAILGATLALFVSAPAGRWVQANITTDSHVAGLRISSVVRLDGGSLVRHRVTIEE